MLADILPFAVLIAALIIVAAVSAVVYPAATAKFFRTRYDFVLRLWNFAGPRLTDRNFVSAMLANSAVLGLFSIRPEVMQWWVLAIVIVANLINPTWDAHPAGERVLKPAEPAGGGAYAEGAAH